MVSVGLPEHCVHSTTVVVKPGGIEGVVYSPVQVLCDGVG